MQQQIDRMKTILEKSTDQQTLRFIKGLMAFYKKHGKLSPKQLAAIDKTWRNQTFGGNK